MQSRVHAIDDQFLQQHLVMKPLESQVGGLGTSKKRLLSLSIQTEENEGNNIDNAVMGIVLKPVRDDHRGVREISFYEQLVTSLVSVDSLSLEHNDDEIGRQQLKIFSEFLPSYYGVIHRGVDDRLMNSMDGITRCKYILLEDVTCAFKKPHVIDIKMGRQTWEPGETPLKIGIETSKYPLQDTYGFRIVGMRCALENLDGVQSFDKVYGRSLETRDHLRSAFKLFFTAIDETVVSEQTSRIHVEAVHTVLSQLYKLQSCFERNNTFAFYASSILIVTEGCRNPHDCEGNIGDRNRPTAVVKMIDFGHVQTNRVGDMGYLHGIATLCGILEDIIKSSNTSII